MPANGVKTRTVTSSSHTRRPERGTDISAFPAAGSTVIAANCGESDGIVTLPVVALASDTGEVSRRGRQPVKSAKSAITTIATRIGTVKKVECLGPETRSREI